MGLRTSNFHFRYGTLIGAYKLSHRLVDPWAFTSLQTRGTGGGMSGEYFNKVYTGIVAGTCDQPPCVDVNVHEPQQGLTNEGFVEGALELGLNIDGFSLTIQGVADDTSSEIESGNLIELKYTGLNLTVWVSSVYADLKAQGSHTNWKIGSQYKVGPQLALGLQYEEAEIGAFDNNADTLNSPQGGKYILGSFDFKKNKVGLAGWVAGYLSDIDDNNRMLDIDGVTRLDENALSWALGVKYYFSKRTQIYGGYRQTDSDNDYRDENVAAFGLRHVF